MFMQFFSLPTNQNSKIIESIISLILRNALVKLYCFLNQFYTKQKCVQIQLFRNVKSVASWFARRSVGDLMESWLLNALI